MQDPGGYEAALDPWLEELLPAVLASGCSTPLPCLPGNQSSSQSHQLKFHVEVQQRSAANGNAQKSQSEDIFRPACAAAADFAALSATASGIAAAHPGSVGHPSASSEVPANGHTHSGAATSSQPYWAPVATTWRLTAQDHWQVGCCTLRMCCSTTTRLQSRALQVASVRCSALILLQLCKLYVCAWPLLLVQERVSMPDGAYVQAVQHVELDISGASAGSLRYEPGDIATMWPRVETDVGRMLLRHLGLSEGAEEDAV